MIKNKKILIFGTGFICENLINQFLKNKNKIVVIYNKHKLLNKYKNVTCYSMNEEVKDILYNEKPNYIICLSGNSFVPDNKNVVKSIETNVLKILSFIENIYTSGLYKNIKKILIIGSASEYGKLYNKPINEDTPFHPTSTYGLTKIMLHQISQYFIELDLPIIYIRQFNTIGVGQRTNFVLPAFAHQIVNIENYKQAPIMKVGDLTQERDFIDIRDTCRAYDLLLRKGSIGEIYNVGSGKFYTVEYLLKLLIKYSTLNDGIIKISKNKDLFFEKNSLSKRLHADITKLKLLGFKPKTSIKKTIKDTLKYWRNKDV